MSSVVISGLRSPTKTWKWSCWEKEKKKDLNVWRRPLNAHAQSVAISRSTAFQLLLKTTWWQLAFTAVRDRSFAWQRYTVSDFKDATVTHTAFTFRVWQTAFKTSQRLPYTGLTCLLNVPRLHENLSLHTLVPSFDRRGIASYSKADLLNRRETQKAHARAGRILNLATMPGLTPREEEIIKKKNTLHCKSLLVKACQFSKANSFGCPANTPCESTCVQCVWIHMQVN